MADIEELKKTIAASFDVAEWDQLHAVLEGVNGDLTTVLDYPLRACIAAGGKETKALPASAAALCAVASIHLVDDMLDGEQSGLHCRIGEPQAANLSLAFQSFGQQILASLEVPPSTSAALQSNYARMFLSTAYGQFLDSREISTEAEYWKVVEFKSAPLFGSAMFWGALIGGAPGPTARALEEAGHLMGIVVQISDDLHDAIDVPAQPDWQKPLSNLALHYAATAEHAEKDAFNELVPKVRTAGSLESAQNILLSSGAVSYCIFKVMEYVERSREKISESGCINPAPLHEILERLDQKIEALFRIAETDTPR